MAITTIVMDVYKPGSELKNKVVDISDSFNARVGDNQVRLVIKYVERGIVERMEQEQLTPFMMGWVGQPDEEQKVTAETGIAVSYHGSTNDIIGGGKVRMDLPGTMFPQEGMFYGFFGLENDKGKRVTTNTVRFQVENDNPDMYVDTEPFRSELQKLLDWATAQAKSDLSGIGTDWEALKKTIKDMIESGDTDLISLKNRIGLAEEDVDKLLKLIDDKDLITKDVFNTRLQEFNDKLQKALNQLQSPVPVDDSIIVGKKVSLSSRNSMNTIKSTIDANKFNLLFFTDPHYGMRSGVTNYGPLYGIDRLNEALYMDDSVDAIVAGGDNIDGHLDSTDGLLNDEQNFALELLFGSRNHADKFALKGNHDDGTLRLRNYRLGIQPSPDYFPTTISSDQFKQHFMTESLLFNEHRNKNSTYFYKDYPDKKVRLIGLDSNDSPEDIKLSDGGVKYIGINNMGYRQDQLDWLANIALQNIPEDYATIVVVHAQATPTENDDTDLSNGMIGHHTNQAQVNQILNDFKNGQSSVVTNSVKDWEVNVKTNFVTQGKRDLVAWIHGHLHHEEYTTSNGFNDISCIAAIGTNTPDKWDETEGGWTLFTLDKTNRKLTTTGYGLATKRTFTY